MATVWMRESLLLRIRHAKALPAEAKLYSRPDIEMTGYDDEAVFEGQPGCRLK